MWSGDYSAEHRCSTVEADQHNPPGLVLFACWLLLIQVREELDTILLDELGQLN